LKHVEGTDSLAVKFQKLERNVDLQEPEGSKMSHQEEKNPNFATVKKLKELAC
jgi:hypothetical protein